MPKEFSLPSADTEKALQLVMKEWHKDLAAVDVRVQIVMVDPPTSADGEATGPALTHGGAPCAGKIKIASPIERLLLKVDAVMQLDNERWEDLSKESRVALIDHELTHLVVYKMLDVEKGVCDQHYDGRPRLAMRRDDYVISGFEEVIERHRKFAIETMSLMRVLDGVQQVFDFEELYNAEPKAAKRAKRSSAKPAA